MSPDSISDPISARTVLDPLFRTVTRRQFLADHYLRLPCAQEGGGEAIAELLSWPAIERMAARPDADLLVARDGELLPDGRGRGRAQGRARELFQAGATLVLRHAERLDPALGAVASVFARDFAAPVNIHLYATPAGRHGFGWHYDAEEVFVVQAAGTKRYTLRKNTLHPWPLVETLPADMGFEHEVTPTWECTLAPGDWLYLPSGTWHRAEAESDSLSLAIGLLPATALDLLDLLRTDLRRSLEWRQRLGILGANPLETPEHTRERLRALLHELAGDFARRLGDERFLERVLASAGQPDVLHPGGPKRHGAAAPPPSDRSGLV